MKNIDYNDEFYQTKVNKVLREDMEAFLIDSGHTTCVPQADVHSYRIFLSSFQRLTNNSHSTNPSNITIICPKKTSKRLLWMPQRVSNVKQFSKIEKRRKETN